MSEILLQGLVTSEELNFPTDQTVVSKQGDFGYYRAAEIANVAEGESRTRTVPWTPRLTVAVSDTMPTSATLLVCCVKKMVRRLYSASLTPYWLHHTNPTESRPPV